MSALDVAAVHDALAAALVAALPAWNVSAWPVQAPNVPQLHILPGDEWVNPWLAMKRGVAKVELIIEAIVSGDPNEGGMRALAALVSSYPVGHGSEGSTIWAAIPDTLTVSGSTCSVTSAANPVRVSMARDEMGGVRFVVAQVPVTIAQNVA